jgi:hypothetical protein
MASPKVATPKAPDPVAPVVTQESSAVQDAYQQQKKKYLNSQGRASTLLAGANYGIGGKSLLGQ